LKFLKKAFSDFSLDSEDENPAAPAAAQPWWCISLIFLCGGKNAWGRPDSTKQATPFNRREGNVEKTGEDVREKEEFFEGETRKEDGGVTNRTTDY
jgi:hypothetical protein